MLSSECQASVDVLLPLLDLHATVLRAVSVELQSDLEIMNLARRTERQSNVGRPKKDRLYLRQPPVSKFLRPVKMNYERRSTISLTKGLANSALYCSRQNMERTLAEGAVELKEAGGELRKMGQIS